jgi:16S rRNA (uracil1498-N3)-methyltransferase
MQLFYTDRIEGDLALLDEEESRHLATVLRRKVGDRLHITDGVGHIFSTELVELGKKQAIARIVATETQAARTQHVHLAVAPTKQMDRFEWMLEKVVEIGIDTITPLHCQRSERDTVRLDRLEKIIVSAMKQSLRAFKPTLQPLTTVANLLKNKPADTQTYMAWCADTPPPHLMEAWIPARPALILIGPEGDFTPAEVALAQQHGAIEVGLGQARLRTETAGLYAVTTAALKSI